MAASVESQSASFIDVSNNTSDNDIVLVNSEKSNSSNKSISKKAKKIKKKTIVIAGDSMVNGIEQSKLSQTRHIRVQPLSGAKTEDLEANPVDLLHKDFENILLHVETNNVVSDSPEDIFSKLISLVNTINSSLPKCNAIVSSLIRRTDKRKTNRVCEKVNTLLKASKYRVLDNSNIKEKHLEKRGIHLNAQGNEILACKLLIAVRNQE